MPDISKITLPNGTTYDLKDTQARSDISAIQGAISGGVTFMGETTTALTDGSEASSITINGNSITAVKGYLVVSGNKEFVYDGTKWIEMGDLSAFKALAYKDSASATYTPAGSVSVTATTSNVTAAVSTASGTATYTPGGTVSVSTNGTTNKTAAVSTASGDATYTPGGTVGAPTISLNAAGSTTTVNSISAVGSLPTLTTTVANETLTIAFDQGSLPVKGADVTVKTGDATYTATAPSFTGSAVRLVTGNIAVPNSYTASFTGSAVRLVTGNIAVPSSYSGTFSGTQATITVE